MRKKTFVYVSGWKKSTSDFGLSGYLFEPETGKLGFIEKVKADIIFNVTCFDPKRGLLYALEEVDDLPGLRGGGGGRVFVFRIDPDTGKLTEIDCRETWCASPCYLTLDQSGEFLIVSHHGGNSAVTKIGEDAFGNYFLKVERDDAAVELFSVNKDGSLGKLLDVDKRYGSGPEKRQAHARPHSAVMSPDGKLFAVCDKGADTVYMYKLDRTAGKLIRPRHTYIHAPATLPRYCVFHPKKPWFYHNCENAMSFYAFTYDADGLLQENGVCSVLPDGAEPQEKVHEQQGLIIDHAGRYIYDIVRGPNVVAVLEIDQQNGSPTVVQYQPISGKWPRGCALSPDGRFLLVCCLGSEKVVEFAVGGDGRLSGTGREYPNAGAAYVTFCEM